jgi:hypothetical protein
VTLFFRHLRFANSPQEQREDNLRLAAIASIHTALQTYVKLEGKVSLWDLEKFGDSANVVCALHRAVEHLLKLRLAKLDLLLLYPLPKKAEDYYRMRGVAMRGDSEPAKTQEEQSRVLIQSHSLKRSRGCTPRPIQRATSSVSRGLVHYETALSITGTEMRAYCKG